MTIASAAGFTLAMTVLAASPGPGVFGVVGRAMVSGVRKTLFMIAGIVTGDILYLIFAIFGLTYVAQNMAGVFTVIRYAGAAYLIWTGFKTAFLSDNGIEEKEGWSDNGAPLSVYLSGLLITLSNPKVILFYCGFLPAFVNLEHLGFRDGMIILMLVMVILSGIMILYAYLAASLGQLVKSPRGRKTMNLSAGGVMMAAGAVLALKR